MKIKLILLLSLISIVIWHVQAACFIYLCDSQADGAKCVNTTDYWVTKSNLNDKKYCECCVNKYIQLGK